MQKLRKVFASAGIVAVLSTLFVAQAATAATFNDVPSNSWFAPYVEELVSLGVVSAENNSYRPGDSLNRAEATKLLVEACDLSGTTSISFSDVSSGAWFHSYVSTAAANMVVEGYSDGTFRPSAAINRAEFVKMANVACDLPDMSSMDNPFTDVASGVWYRDHVVTSYWNSVIDGVNGSDKFAPGNSINRAEAAKVIANTMDPVERPEEPTGPVQGGSVSVSKSTSGPGSVVGIPKGATGVHVASFDFKAGTQDATVQALTLKRRDTGDPADFSRIYLYVGDNSLTNGKSLNSSSNEVIFSNLGLQVAAGKTVTVDVVVDIACVGLDCVDTPGSGIHRFVLEAATSVEAGGSVTGSFPVSSDQFSTGSVAAGALTVDVNGTTYTRTTGEVDVEVGGFRVDVTNKEDVHFEKITLYNDDDDVLSNLTLWRGSEKVATAMQDGRRFTFVLDEPIAIQKGNAVAFKVRGDVSGRDGDTAELYVRYRADVTAVGQTFGYGVNVSGGNYVDETGGVSRSTTTVQAGQFTIVFNGPTSSDVSNDMNDVVLMNFNLTPDSTVNVERARVLFDVTEVGAALTDASLSNPEIVCNGSVVAQENTVPAGGVVDFNDDWTLTGGETANCQVRVDIEATGTGTIQATLVNAGWTIRDNDSNDQISEIIPSGDIQGNEMEVVEASLDVAISSLVPSSQSYVKGTMGADAVAFTFDAGESDDVTVNALEFTGLVSDEAVGPTYDETARDIIVKVSLYESTDLTTPIVAGKSLSTNGTVQFNSLNWQIAAGQTATLVVKVDLATSAPLSANADRFAVSLTSVDAEYGNGSSLTVNGTPTNAAGTVSQVVDGTGTIALDAPNAPAAALAAADETTTAHVIRFRADDEAFEVQDLTIEGTNEDQLTSVTLAYKNAEGADVTVTRGFTGANASFTSLSPAIYVPKDGTATVTVRVTVAGKNSLTNGTDVTVNPISYKAVGVDSQQTVTNAQNFQSNALTVYKAYPTFAFAASSETKLIPGSADFELAKLSITAKGSEAVVFSEAATANEIELVVSGQCTGAGAALADVTLRDSDNNVVAEFTYAGVETLCAGDTATLVFTDTVNIAPGTTETFTIHGDTTGFTGDSDSVQLRLLSASATDFAIDGETPKVNYTESAILFRGNLSSPVLSK
ncbi:hypothetical protein CVV38_01565 [Candidatus Peregrinibacteria bacterium HGW-Peregrinibacteria-1]|jgi:hypothetical protein|nr:MAG: hypothetical protein CVV38_01565 [Candidatus Peregrinibacteria bacterium HGW-Peregrinibacteria-1]